MGRTAGDKRNDLRNAMMVITYWGENNRQEDHLHDYAYKEWSGMMAGFYKKRWELYFDYLTRQLKGEKVESPDYFDWERRWVHEHLSIIKDKSDVSLDKIVAEILQ
jgi:alpha-N-acetylglucosaminidase